MEQVKNIIKKAALKNNRCEVDFKERFTAANYTNEVTKRCDQIVHPDLVLAFSLLRPFLITITEQPESGLFNNGNINENPTEDIEKEIGKYVVTGYTRGGSEESSGVSLTGQKILKSGQVLNLNAPFVKFVDESPDAYTYGDELRSAMERCDWEVSEYLFSGKYGIIQQQLDFDGESAGENTEEPPKKKTGRKVKVEEPAVFDATA